MKSQGIKRTWLGSDSRSESGFMTECKYCGETIYMHLGADGRYRPFESWVAGNANDGQWVYHDCGGSGRSSRRDPNHVDLPPMRKELVAPLRKQRPLAKCPYCHVDVRVGKLDKHIREKCPSARAGRAPTD